MVEALYLYGTMLLLLDMRIDGVVRERMLVSYLRYVGQSELPNVDEVCKICAKTGFVNRARRPDNYPHEYFQRNCIPDRVISMIIGRLRSDDIYSQIAAYPLPEHRSAALATQGAMVYVILYFDPDILSNQQAVMREIVDKHFPDNWVIPWYLGFTVDLSVEWKSYKAAFMALQNTIDLQHVARLRTTYLKKVPVLNQALENFLLDGVLTEDFILEKKNRLMMCLRDCNVTLRWFVLHTLGTVSKKIKDAASEGVNLQEIMNMLLNIAQFEFVLKSMFQNLLDSKEAKWNESKADAAQRMRDLGNYFSGEAALVKIKKIERLQKWFSEEMATTVESLDFKEINVSTRKIQQLLKALEEVEQHHQLETNLQVTQFLGESRSIIKKMLRLANLTDEVMISFSIISDCAYLFEIIDNFIDLMQSSIKKNPGVVLKLRSTFVKLATVLQIPLIRINQAKSRDIISVSQYYSGELVAFVRRVMEVIPKSMFIALKEVINIQTNLIKEVPSKLDKEQLKDYAQLDHRFRLSELTYNISVFTKGILAMKTTFVGLVAIDPKQLLEDGIRKELVEQMSNALNSILMFDSHKIMEFERVLRVLASTLDGFKRSFQYIQDYVNIYGLKIWQEEFLRVVGFNVEQECNTFLKKRVHEWESYYQSVSIPIPKFKPVDQTSVTFIGRLGREIILHTSYKGTIFIDETSAWYDLSGREVISLRTFNLLVNSVETFGVTGIDKLYSYMILADLKSIDTKIGLALKQPNTKALIFQTLSSLEPFDAIPENISRIHYHASSGLQKFFDSLLDTVASIGHKQLLRRHIATALNSSCKINSTLLFESLKIFDTAMIKEVKTHEVTPDKPYPDTQENDIIAELTSYLNNTGQNDPLSQIYMIPNQSEGIECILFFITIGYIQKVRIDEKLDMLTTRRSKGIDPAPFTVGICTLLKQHHSGYTQRYLALLGQWVKTLIIQSENKVKLALDVTHTSMFLENFCKYGNISREVVNEYIPVSIFDNKK